MWKGFFALNGSGSISIFIGARANEGEGRDEDGGEIIAAGRHRPEQREDVLLVVRGDDDDDDVES